MSKQQIRNILINLSILAILSIGALIYLWNRNYPEIAHCFYNAPDLQAVVSDAPSEQSHSDLLGLPRITSNNVHELANLHSFGTLDGRVTALAVSPDDTVIASVSINGPINVFHFTTQQTITISENKGIIESLAISPSNHILASYNSSGDITLWDTYHGNQIARWRVDGPSMHNRLLFLSPQELIYSTGMSVYLCNLASKENRKLFDSRGVATFENGNIFDRGGVASLAEIMMSDDGLNLIYSTNGNNDSTGVPEVGIWNFASKMKSQSFKLHDTEISDISLSANGQRLASISGDGTIYIVDLQTNETLSSFTTENAAYVDYAIALNWDGSLVFVADQSTGNLSAWNVETGTFINSDLFETENITDVIFSTTGNMVIFGGADDSITLWRIE